MVFLPVAPSVLVSFLLVTRTGRLLFVASMERAAVAVQIPYILYKLNNFFTLDSITIHCLIAILLLLKLQLLKKLTNYFNKKIDITLLVLAYLLLRVIMLHFLGPW